MGHKLQKSNQQGGRKTKVLFLEAKERAIKERYISRQITWAQMLMEIGELMDSQLIQEMAKQQAIEDAKWEEHYLDCISECLSTHPSTGEPV